MSTNFPTGLDSFVDPQGNQSLNNPPHSQQHANANDAIAALQTKVGIDDSSDINSLDYKIAHVVTNDQLATPNGIATLDNNGLIPISELPVEATTLLLAGNYGGTAPNNDIGLNDDYAIDLSTGQVWGPKSGGNWPGSSVVTFGSSNGSSPGYTQLMLSYNGNGPIAVDCMVGEGYDMSVGGYVFALAPVALLFGGGGPNIPVTAYVDGSGTVQSFTMFITEEGAIAESFDNAGNASPLELYGPNNGSIAVDNSGNIYLSADGANWIVQASDGRFSYPGGNSIYTYPTIGDFTGHGSDGDIGIVGSGSGAQILIHSGGQWIPYPYNIGYIETVLQVLHSDDSSTVLARNTTSAPLAEAPIAGYVSQYPDRISSMTPLNAIANTDQIQLLVYPSISVNLFDTFDVSGVVTIWDGSGSNILVCTFSANALNSASGPLQLSLSQVQVIGSDLSVTGDNILSANGGSYNVLVETLVVWD